MPPPDPSPPPGSQFLESRTEFYHFASNVTAMLELESVEMSVDVTGGMNPEDHPIRTNSHFDWGKAPNTHYKI